MIDFTYILVVVALELSPLTHELQREEELMLDSSNQCAWELVNKTRRTSYNKMKNEKWKKKIILAWPRKHQQRDLNHLYTRQFPKVVHLSPGDIGQE